MTFSATKTAGLSHVWCSRNEDEASTPSDFLRHLRHAAVPDGMDRMQTFLASDEQVRTRELMRLPRENKWPLPPGLRNVANKTARN
ncbi:hypothetical protein MRX96_055175 [Rhipicephalus microplus]